MKDVKEFLENKSVNMLDDSELCECIDYAPDWEFCEMYGLLDEISKRSNTDFIVNDEFNDSLVYDAMEKLGYRL